MRAIIVQRWFLPSPGLTLHSNVNDSTSQQLLNQALATARQQPLSYARELDGLDRQDFLDYVCACKMNLAYPDLTAVTLPAAFAKAAQLWRWRLQPSCPGIWI